MIRGAVKEAVRAIWHHYNAVTDPKPKLLVLLYHKVMPRPGADPMRLVVTPVTFEKQMAHISGNFPVVPLSSAAGQKNRVAITFDDGYASVYDFAMPVLSGKNIRPAVFLSTEKVGGDGYVGWQQAREMAGMGAEIGSHAITHRSLTGMPFEEAKREIVDSKKIIEDKLGKACEYFAFPFGSRADYNDSLIDIVRSAGYRLCLLNIHGYNHFDKGAFCLKRIIMGEGTNMCHLLG